MVEKLKTVVVKAPEYHPECKNCRIANELIGRVFNNTSWDPAYRDANPDIDVTCLAKDHPVCPAYKPPPRRLH